MELVRAATMPDAVNYNALRGSACLRTLGREREQLKYWILDTSIANQHSGFKSVKVS